MNLLQGAMMFYRLATDGTKEQFNLQNLYAGAFPSACWIIGGGISLKELPVQEIARSPIPKFAVNLAGSGLLRPNFWTSYDPTTRFHRSVYLDPSIIKFLHSCRSMDLVPESTFKVCDSPATLFFDRSRVNSYQQFLTNKLTIPDWQDSFLQAIQIAYQLGFRKLFLAGCEMYVRPTKEQLDLAATRGVCYTEQELLKDFVQRTLQAGIKKSDMQRLNQGGQYHFEESKSLDATLQTDFHYFRVAQYLRLARKALSNAGLQVISVTPRSRLNDYFPCQTVESVVYSLHTEIGDPSTELTQGLYLETRDRSPENLAPMRDFKPHFQNELKPTPSKNPPAPPRIEIPETPVHLVENPR